MQGMILSYDKSSNKGIISGDDGIRYEFNNLSFKSTNIIKDGLKVDFQVIDGIATEIYIVKIRTSATDVLDAVSSSKPVAIKIVKFVVIAFIVFFIGLNLIMYMRHGANW